MFSFLALQVGGAGWETFIHWNIYLVLKKGGDEKDQQTISCFIEERMNI